MKIVTEVIKEVIINCYEYLSFCMDKKEFSLVRLW